MEFDGAVRQADARDALTVARLLHDFNTEFATPSPGPEVLERRLRTLLAAGDGTGTGTGTGTTAYLAETRAPTRAVGIALITWRPNVWYEGPVALLDELYVVPDARSRGIGSALLTRLTADASATGAGAIEIGVDEPDLDVQRFYRRHGFETGDGAAERAFLFSREL
jgi:GNAT superfamily N-acetyltransferase